MASQTSPAVTGKGQQTLTVEKVEMALETSSAATEKAKKISD